MKKTIEFYVREHYGNRCEYIKNEHDAEIVRRLTGKKTVNSVVRELLHDLSAGTINFVQVLVDY
jgi:hypothetical protein